jgi:hypothetical protein
MKALLTAVASASLLLASAAAFAQASNGAGNAAAPGANPQTWQQQPAMNYQAAPANANSANNANIDYGMPANGTYQSGRAISQGGFTEPTFGHH